MQTKINDVIADDKKVGQQIYFFMYFFDGLFRGAILTVAPNLEEGIAIVEDMKIEPVYDVREKYLLYEKPLGLSTERLYGSTELVKRGIIEIKG